MKTAALTVAALAGFAANSLLCRRALHSGTIDAASFTAVRLLSGAFVLAILAGAARRRGDPALGGSWISAAALFAYAAAFSYAYLRIPAGVGALILFGVVQVTMIGGSWVAGERPRPVEWMGLVIAFGGLIALTAPGLSAPDALGAGLMSLAGVSWGIYSLRGRTTQRPLASTAGNFIRSVPAGLALAAISVSSINLSVEGACLAILSGALASGVGYSLWYAALPHLRSASAAIVQLAVPALAAGAGVALLGEVLTPRLAVCGLAILGGVAIALQGRASRS